MLASSSTSVDRLTLNPVKFMRELLPIEEPVLLIELVVSEDNVLRSGCIQIMTEAMVNRDFDSIPLHNYALRG